MSKAFPFLKFFPTDHQADAALRTCSLAARGLWVEMLCLMHDAEPYGHLLLQGKEVTPKQLATLAGASPNLVQRLIAELEGRGVFSRTREGVIYSRRMVRDLAKRQADAENGRKGGNPALKGGVNPLYKPRLKTQNPENPESKTDSRGKVHIKVDTAPWFAWRDHLGRSLPIDRSFGWWVDTEYPPSHSLSRKSEDAEE